MKANNSRLIKRAWNMNGKDGFTYYVEFPYKDETVQVRVNGKEANLVPLEKIALNEVCDLEE